MSIDELISEGFHRQERWSKRVATLLTVAIILLLLIASLLLLQLSQSQHMVLQTLFHDDKTGSRFENDLSNIKQAESSIAAQKGGRVKRSTAGRESIAVIESALTRLSNDMNGKMDKLVAACQIGVNGNPSQVDGQVKQIVDSVEIIKRRVTIRDYLQPNDSCPTFKPGLSHFQYVGPKDEFSKCYYMEPPPPQYRSRNRRYNAYTFEKAQSICEEKGGRLVEIHTKNELEYLTKNLSPKFWLGAKRNTDTGMWHWDSDGNEVNMGLWKDFPTTLNDDDEWMPDPRNPNEPQRFKTRAMVTESNLQIPFEQTWDDWRGEELDVICEAPSKFVHLNPPSADPFPDQVREKEFLVDEGNEPNVTYLFSDFKLPWAGAQKFCQSRGGWLAEIRTEQENENLMLKSRNLRRDYWLGGKMADFSTGWRWSRENRSFDEGFTSWNERDYGEREPLKPPTCLQSEYGLKWEYESCNNWRRFVCEIRDKDWTPKWPSHTSSAFVSNKTCLKTQNDVESCFQFVYLQRTRAKAEAFCAEQLGGSIAKVDADMRRGYGNTTGFDSLLQGQLDRLHKKGWYYSKDWMDWWMDISPIAKITMVTLDDPTIDDPDKVGEVAEEVAEVAEVAPAYDYPDEVDVGPDAQMNKKPKQLVLLNGKPICSHKLRWRRSTTAYTICRQLGWLGVRETGKIDYLKLENKTHPPEIPSHGKNVPMLEVYCGGDMPNLDDCAIYEDRPCPGFEAMTLACDHFPITTTQCGYARAYSKGTNSKEDDCEKMKGFVCNVT